MCLIIEFHCVNYVFRLNLFYLLDLDEVLHALDHALDDRRIVVLDHRVDALQAQGVEVLALTLRSSDAALDLGDFQFCHFRFEINR